MGIHAAKGVTETKVRSTILLLAPAQLSCGGRVISERPMTVRRGRRLTPLVIAPGCAAEKRGSPVPTVVAPQLIT